MKFGDDLSSQSRSQFDAADEDLSSVSHGLANKMIPATTVIRASMMKEKPNMMGGADSEDSDDFFDALD